MARQIISLMSGQQSLRSRRWCFTLNNPTEQEESMLQGMVSSGQANYLVFGRERGAEGTAHLQGYVEVPKKRTLSSMKSLLPRAHLEISRGSKESNRDYCTKEDSNPFEEGLDVHLDPQVDWQDQEDHEFHDWFNPMDFEAALMHYITN